MSTSALTAESAAEPLATTAVAIQGANFVPETVTISVGDTVRWTNNDDSTHTTTSDSGLWDTTLDRGQSYSQTFTTAGTFNYHCAIHPTMTGSITVQ